MEGQHFAPNSLELVQIGDVGLCVARKGLFDVPGKEVEVFLLKSRIAQTIIGADKELVHQLQCTRVVGITGSVVAGRGSDRLEIGANLKTIPDEFAFGRGGATPNRVGDVCSAVRDLHFFAGLSALES